MRRSLLKTVFANQKGGTGKSTLAVLFARWLVERAGLRVCVVDLDAQCNASKSLREFDGGVSAMQLFDMAPMEVTSGPLVLVAGSRALVDVERARPEVVIPAFVHQMGLLVSGFDACVIDTPPALGLRMTAALIAADYVACPIELEEYSIDGVTEMLKTVFGVRQRYNPELELVGLIANRFNPHSPRQKQALADLLAHHAAFMVPGKISTRSAIPESLALGVPVWRLAKTAAREASAEVCAVFSLLREKMLSRAGAGDAELSASEHAAGAEAARAEAAR